MYHLKDEKSQIKNKEKAMKVLRARIYDKFQQEARLNMIKHGNQQSDLVTVLNVSAYNFPQNRVTDHRIGLTIQKLDQILEGKLDEVVEALIVEDQASKLQQSEG
ncbi:peptide chain release factor-like protein [Bacillus stercoris]|nr:peptide chain release factor-like protein [Bacillus stercoris]